MNLKKIDEKAIESARDIIEALSKIGEAITSDLYLEDVLKLIVAVTAEVMDSKICSLMLLDPKTKELAIKATQSISREYIDKDPLKLGEGIAGRVAVENKPEVVYNISENKDISGNDMDAIYWIMFYCDGHNTILDIAEKADLPVKQIYLVAKKLCDNGLLAQIHNIMD